jgi:sugar phosphate isomerase/epimerase
MRYGYCFGADFVDGNENSAKLFDYIVNAGYDYIETQLSIVAGFDDEKYAKFKKMLADRNIPCKANFLLFPHSMILAGDDFDIGVIKSHAEKVLSVAADFGSETVVFGNGGSRAVKEGMDKDKVYAQMVEIVAAVDPICGKYGVDVVVEPLNFKETNMINSFMDGVNLIKDAGAKHVGVLCDWYHVRMNDQTADDIIGHESYLKHLHIARPVTRRIPSLEDATFEYENFAEVIKKVGYDNKISIEAGDPEITEAKVADGLKLLKKLFD